MIKEKTNWKVEVSSKASTHGLSDEQIKELFVYHNHPEYVDFKNEMKEKDKQYDIYPVAKWQLEKVHEVEQLFHNNIKFEINGDIVTVSTNFEVTFPDSFKKDDVLNWTEGFHRFSKLVPMVAMYNIMNNSFDEERNEKEKKFTEELSNNEIHKIVKL